MWTPRFISQLKDNTAVADNGLVNPTAKLIGQLLAVEELMLEELRELKMSLPYSNTRKDIEVIIEISGQMIQYAKTNETRFLPIQQLLQRHLYAAHRLILQYEDLMLTVIPEQQSAGSLPNIEAAIDRLRIDLISEYRDLLRSAVEQP